MHKPVVFLDIDGVLNSKQWYAHDAATHEGISPLSTERKLWEHSIDPDCVQRLNRILQQTGAVVIVSSSWRKKHALSEIVSILESRGFRGEVDGATSANGTLSRTEPANPRSRLRWSPRLPAPQQLFACGHRWVMWGPQSEPTG
jgi:hypothetical protein